MCWDITDNLLFGILVIYLTIKRIVMYDGLDRISIRDGRMDR